MLVRGSTRSTADAAPNLLSIFCSIFSSLMNKTPRHLNSFCWGRSSPPNLRRQSTIFQKGTMASDLEVLTLIPVASHSTANNPSACWRSRAEEANKTTFLQRAVRFPDRTLPSQSLCLEILSMNITNRIRNKGQPWQSPTPTGKRPDLNVHFHSTFFPLIFFIFLQGYLKSSVPNQKLYYTKKTIWVGSS